MRKLIHCDMVVSVYVYDFFRTWCPALLAFFGSFISIETTMRWYELNRPVCLAENFSGWTVYANCVQAGSFLISCVIAVSILLTAKTSRSMICSTVVTLSISFMCGVSSFLTLFYNWGGVCEDAFGYDLLCIVS